MSEIPVLPPAASPLPLAKLVTPAQGREEPVHRWFLYPHSYSPGLVRTVVSALNLARSTILYDPFAGAGTTLRTAREEGFSGYGVDMLPLSVLLTNAKVASYEAGRLERSWQRLCQRLSTSPTHRVGPMSDIPLVAKAFSPQVWSSLVRIRSSITDEPSSKHQKFFQVALARLAEDVSTAVKSGGWLRLTERQIEPESVYPQYAAFVEAMLDDVRAETNSVSDGEWRCYLGNSTRPPRVPQYGAVITSPPYLNRHDYTRVLALEHAVVFGTTQSELIKRRRNSLRSHVEARRSERVKGYKVPVELEDALPNIQDATNKDSRVYPMITGYFEDIFLSLRAIEGRLLRGGYVAFVLGDVRFGGIMIPVETAVRRIGEQVGLEWRATWQARTRGNSAQQMKAYGREPAREYVIFWQATKP